MVIAFIDKITQRKCQVRGKEILEQNAAGHHYLKDRWGTHNRNESMKSYKLGRVFQAGQSWRWSLMKWSKIQTSKDQPHLAAEVPSVSLAKVALLAEVNMQCVKEWLEAWMER